MSPDAKRSESAGPLDLRFDPASGEPAARLVNRMAERQLADLIYRFGEERFSRRIARAIVERRNEREIVSASELAEIVRRAIPHNRHLARIDPATRTFQAGRPAGGHQFSFARGPPGEGGISPR